MHVVQLMSLPLNVAPRGAGHPFRLFPNLVPSPPHHLLFFTFPIFLFSFAVFSSFVHPVPFSTRVVPLRFQAGGRSRRPNLGLVCSLVSVKSKQTRTSGDWAVDEDDYKTTVSTGAVGVM